MVVAQLQEELSRGAQLVLAAQEARTAVISADELTATAEALEGALRDVRGATGRVRKKLKDAEDRAAAMAAMHAKAERSKMARERVGELRGVLTAVREDTRRRCDDREMTQGRALKEALRRFRLLVMLLSSFIHSFYSLPFLPFFASSFVILLYLFSHPINPVPLSPLSPPLPLPPSHLSPLTSHPLFIQRKNKCAPPPAMTPGMTALIARVEATSGVARESAAVALSKVMALSDDSPATSFGAFGGGGTFGSQGGGEDGGEGGGHRTSTQRFGRRQRQWRWHLAVLRSKHW